MGICRRNVLVTVTFFKNSPWTAWDHANSSRKALPTIRQPKQRTRETEQSDPAGGPPGRARPPCDSPEYSRKKKDIEIISNIITMASKGM